MRKWILLAVAIAIEVVASLSLKAALEHPAWFALVAAGYVAAFILLARILRLGVPIGVAYGIWGASGVALTALLSALIFGEPLTPVMLGGIALIILGILCVQVGSERAAMKKRELV